MIIDSFIRFSIVLTLIIILNGSCNSQIDYTLDADIVKYSRDSFNIQQAAGMEYKIVSSKIRDERVLSMAIDGSQGSYFVIASIKTKKIELINKNIIDKYYSTLWDASSNKLVAASAQRPYDLFVSNIATGDVEKENCHVDWLSSTDIIIEGDQLFYLNGVTGVAFVNFKTKNSKTFRNSGMVTTDPYSSVISYPLDKALNLLSGHTIENNTIQVYAIDKQDSIRWKYLIVQNRKREPVSLLNYATSFVLKYDSILVAVDKVKGQEVWRNTLNNAVTEVYQWQNKILVYCLVNSSGLYPDRDDFEYKVVLKLFDSEKGKEIWSVDVNSVNVPSLGLCNDNLLLSDNRSFTVFSLNNGTVVEKKSFSKKDKSRYSFEMLTDMKTGRYYLKSYDWKLYW